LFFCLNVQVKILTHDVVKILLCISVDVDV